MRKHFIATGIAVVLALTLVSLPANAQETETVSGTLTSVDLEAQSIVVTQDDDTTITLVINEETTVEGPTGEPQMLSALASAEGSALTAEYVAGEQNIAVTIRLTAN